MRAFSRMRDRRSNTFLCPERQQWLFPPKSVVPSPMTDLESCRRAGVRPFCGWFAVLLFFSPGASAGQPADLVVLKDGRNLRGTVVDLGGNRIELQIAAGTKRILKRDIDRIEFDASRRRARVEDADVVIRQGGQRIVGKVELLDGGKLVRVTLPGGSAAEIPRKDVLKIIYRGELSQYDSTVYTAELAQAIEAAIAVLARDDGGEARPTESPAEFESAKEAEDFLCRCGILAIQRVRAALQSADASSAFGKALARIDRLHRLKEAMATEIEEIDSQVYDTLVGENTEKKCNLLLLAFGRYPDESVPLALFLSLDPLQDAIVRAWSIEFLRKWRRNRELLDVYRKTTGKEQLAAAVALGRNRILLGVPTLLEAMEAEMPEVRRLAGEQLVRITGKDLGFRPDDPSDARRQALDKWKAWWKDNESSIIKASEVLLKGGDVESEDRKAAIELWKQASVDAARGRLKDAELGFRKALAVDPTFHRAAVGLAVLLYGRLGRPKEAADLLESLQGDPSAWSELGEKESVSLHLGNSLSLAGEPEKAIESYRRCLLANPENFEAAAGLGDAAFRVAVSAKELGAQERKEWLETALKSYRAALDALDKRVSSLTVVGPTDLPGNFELLYDRREFNRSVLGLRERLRYRRFEVRFSIVKILTVRNENEAALRELAVMIQEVSGDPSEEFRRLEASMRSFLGLLYEKLDRPLLAFQEYRKVLDELDPNDQASRDGVERLRKRVEGKEK